MFDTPRPTTPIMPTSETKPPNVMPIAVATRISFFIDADALFPVETGFVFDFFGTMIASSSSFATGPQGTRMPTVRQAA